MENLKKPKVVIFGRANVGKSTLLNCLTEKKIALVSDIAGTTRDENAGDVEWENRSFRLIDTGGLLDFDFLSANRNQQKKNRNSSDIDTNVQQKSLDSLKEASLIIFMVDARAGLLPQDKTMALELKKLKNNKIIKGEIILAANKADNPRLRKDCVEFNRLGLGEPLPLSATTGSGTGDLLDLIVEKLGKKGLAGDSETGIPDAGGKIADSTISIAIIGKPNVGKSSLLNALLGEKKMIVSPTAHTTREPKDETIHYKNHVLTFIDTAGISKRGQKNVKKIKQKSKLEKLSIEKSLAALDKAQIALLVIDIHEGLTHQEAKLVEEISKRKSGLIIVANKWDLIKEKDEKIYSRSIYADLPFATWAPLIFMSALRGGKTNKLLDLVLEINENYREEVSANALGKLLNRIVKKHLPKKAKGTKHPHIYEFVQTKTAPPKFKIRIGAKDTIHFSYIRFIQNRLREKFGFRGIPLSIYVEKNRQVHGKHDEMTANKKPKSKKSAK